MPGEIISTEPISRDSVAHTQREIRRQAELYLAAQLQSGIAADQRAMSFLSLMAAAAVVAAGGGGSLILADKPHVALGWICIAIAACFAISMGSAASSAMPVDFWYGGSMPKDWEEDIEFNKSGEEMLSEELSNLQNRIIDNNITLRRNAKWMSFAIWSSWIGLIIGGITGSFILYYR